MLAGEGCFLKVFEASTSKFLAKCKIFNAQTIHGIAVTDPVGHDTGIKATFWGGKSFVLLGAEELEAIVAGDLNSIAGFESVAPDWILDGAISPFPGFSPCIFVTAHSATLRTARGGSSRRTLLKPLPSPSRSILYSAHVLWTSSDSIMVAGGTVFGEIEVIVWRKVSHDALVHSRQLFTFTGHEGSVFGVRISPEIADHNGGTIRYLASCSDDRTIRVWDVSLPVGEEDSLDLEPRPSASIRQTGFGENDSTSVNNASEKRGVAIIMAHASRIWRVHFITWKGSLPGSTTKVHILSFGEDSTCQQWSIDFLNRSSELKGNIRHNTSILGTGQSLTYPAVLTHLNTFSYHSGKHIWSIALSFISETSRRLVTGGADGKVAIYDISLEASCETSSVEATKPSEAGERISKQRELPTASRSWALEDILNDIAFANRGPDDTSMRVETYQKVSQSPETLETGNLAKAKTKKQAQVTKDTPNRYGFVGRNELLITTSFGRVLLALIGEPHKWEELDLPEKVSGDLKSYSLLLGVPDFGLALLAGANGTIYMYHKKAVAELIKVNGKPAALLNVSVPGEERLGILVTTLGSDVIHRLSISTSAVQSLSLDEVVTIKLPPSFVVTGAGDIRGQLILGARNGSLAVYDLGFSRDPLEVIPGQQSQSDDAVTTVIDVPPTPTQDSNWHFLTTTRNGSYSIFSLSKAKVHEEGTKKVSLDLVHQSFPPLGPMIEAAWFSNSDLMLYGFRSKSFVVWNETKQCEISSIECGGAHRSYSYLPNPEIGGAGHFAYTKASRLYLHSQRHPSHIVLKPGGHGREIKATAQHSDFIATGAEDTIIRIWRIHREGGEPPRIFITVDGEAGKYGNISLECCAVIEKHTTGIQHLQWSCSTEEYHSLFSAGGNEEFHVWAVSNIPGFGVGVVCEATLTDKSEDGDLRIMGFDVEFVPDRRLHKIVDGAPPTPLGRNQITLIYSDSTIKCYDYSRTLGFQKTAQGKYTSACLIQAVSLRVGRGLEKFFTASTDGHLALWERPQRNYVPPEALGALPLTEDISVPELKLTSRLKLHQSSISALAIEHLTLISQSGGLLVATGGDDNALAITFFYLLQPVKRIVIPSAHAAGIFGVAFKSDVTGGTAEETWYQLWTVGGDQRVKRWTIELGRHDEVPTPTMENGLNMRVWAMDEEDDVWCSVADPAGLVTWRDNWEESRCLVFGNGMEVFRLKDGFPNGDGMRWVGIVEEKVVKRWEEDDEEEYERE